MEQVENKAMIEVCLNCPRKTCRSGICARYRAALAGKNQDTEQAGRKRQTARRGKEYEANGQWKTLPEWAAECGIDANTLKYRVCNRGWSLEHAMSAPLKSNGSEDFEAFGETHTLREWARIRGIPQKTLSSRIYSNKWPIEKALTEPVRKARHYTAFGETKSGCEWAEALDISYATVNLRLRQGWDMERIAAHYGGRK